MFKDYLKNVNSEAIDNTIKNDTSIKNNTSSSGFRDYLNSKTVSDVEKNTSSLKPTSDSDFKKFLNEPKSDTNINLPQNKKVEQKPEWQKLLDFINPFKNNDIDIKGTIFEYPENFYRGVTGATLSIPQTVGGLMKEAGEVLGSNPELEDKPTGIDYLNPFHYAGVAFSKLKTYKQFEKTDVDEKIAEFGQDLIDKNREFIKKSGFSPEGIDTKTGEFLYELGGAASSLGEAMGLTIVTGNPTVATVLFGLQRKAQAYEEARAAGKTPLRASEISSLGGTIEGSLEYLGLEFLMSKFGGSKFLGLMVKSGSEALQEWSQEVGSNVIAKFSYDDQRGVFQGAGRAALIGFITGLPTSAMVSSVKNTKSGEILKKNGLTERQSDGLLTKIITSQKQKIAPELMKSVKEAIKESSEVKKAETIPEKTREKGFIKTIKESPMTSLEVKESAEQRINPIYEVLNNKDVVNKVEADINEDINGVRKYVMSNETPDAIKTASAILLMKAYENIGDIDNVVEIGNNYDAQLRKAGQAIQAATLWNKLNPNTMAKVAIKLGEKYNAKFTEEMQRKIIEKMAEINNMPNGSEKTSATFELLNYVADNLPITAGEMFDAYRYQNMLSNIKSHLRNIHGNLLQTFITRPLDIFSQVVWEKTPFAKDKSVDFSDVPKYYKNTLAAIHDATMAFKEGLRSGKISEKNMELSMDKSASAIEDLRWRKFKGKVSGKILTTIPTLMEAQDKFFSTLIAAGEKYRLMEKGVSEIDADVQAKRLAEKYLFREKLGESKDTEALAVQAIDAVGKMALNMRRTPLIGKMFGWFVPFITTSTNIAKTNVEHSAFGLIGGKHTNEQMSKAFLGAIVSLIGAFFAANDDTTWAAPTDKKNKELFYASGKKPYSIRIDDKWHPLWYAGPFALSLAIPAAIKHYYTESKSVMTDNDIAKVTKALFGSSRFLMSQTSLSSVSDFISFLSGDEYTLQEQAGNVSRQFVPFAGLLAWVAHIIDPIFRKSSGYWESIIKDIPFASKSVKPIREITGKPAKRSPWDFLLPYDMGSANDIWENYRKANIKKLQINYKINQIKKKYGL